MVVSSPIHTSIKVGYLLIIFQTGVKIWKNPQILCHQNYSYNVYEKFLLGTLPKSLRKCKQLKVGIIKQICNFAPCWNEKNITNHPACFFCNVCQKYLKRRVICQKLSADQISVIKTNICWDHFRKSFFHIYDKTVFV